jgi:uncharacterized protein YjiS (DUF1127 family)
LLPCRDFGSFAGEGPSKTETAPKRAGILRRIFDAFMEARQRVVDRQITRLLAARSAERLTDDLEREIDLAAALNVELERKNEPVRREEVPMTSRSHTALPGALFEYHTRQRAAAKLFAAIASQLAELRSAWERRAARRRLARSIAHLDDRLLTDIGLGPEDLGFAERGTRRRATGFGIWAGSKAGPGTDWQ